MDWWKGPVASVEALNSIWSQIGGVHPQARNAQSSFDSGSLLGEGYKLAILERH